MTQLNEKLTSAKKDYLSETERTLMLKNTLKKIKIDLHNMSANLQDPNKLKINVKVRSKIVYNIINLFVERMVQDAVW